MASMDAIVILFLLLLSTLNGPLGMKNQGIQRETSSDLQTGFHLRAG